MNAALDAPGVRLTTEGLIATRAVALRTAGAAALSALPGTFGAKRRGQGQDVVDLRDYVPGDDIRHIDRGATARTGTIHIRTYREERDRSVLLVADFRPPMLWGLSRAFLSVAAAEALCLLGWRMVEGGGRVGLLAIGPASCTVVPVRGRTNGMLAVIGGLVRAHAEALRAAPVDGPPVPLDRDLARAARIAPRGGETAIASNFEDPGPRFDGVLDALSARGPLRLLDIRDGLVRRLPRGAYPVRRGDGTRLRIRVASQAPAETAPRRIAGRAATHLDAAAPVAELARRLAEDDRAAS